MGRLKREAVEAAIEAENRRHAANMEVLANQLMEARDTPDEPGFRAVVRFDVQFHRDGTTYTYWAARFAPAGTRARWTITGRAGSWTWEEVVDLMSKDWRVENGVPVMFRVIG